MRIRFADCQLDTDTRELTRAGQAQRLTPKAFALLSTLVEQRPRALSKAELHDQVWPETFVGRSSLARLVHEIRRAIGDDAAEPRLVRTVGGVGYAFAAEVVDVPRAVTMEPRGLGPRIHGARVDARLMLPGGRELEIGLLVVDVLAHRAPPRPPQDERPS
jgi:DNA-binding winged helix-turn-helix (wHTH) protein